MPIQIMQFNEEKKHSVRYDAAPGTVKPMLTSVYVMKTALPNPYPRSISVQIEEESK